MNRFNYVMLAVFFIVFSMLFISNNERIAIEKKNFQLMHDLQHYKIANSKNIARQNRSEEKEIIKQYINPCIPVNLMFAIRVHENGSKSHDFGAKKFFNYHEYAQYETANKIIEQEVYKFIEKNKEEFVIHLAKRWNEKDSKNWSKSVLKIWEAEYDKR